MKTISIRLSALNILSKLINRKSVRVSVIIPAINEGQTIGTVVELVKGSSLVDEVIVVDDHSADNTVECAKLAGAMVISSTKIGKGASMAEGLHVARNEIVIFLDGDITNYNPNIIELMVAPIVYNKADFVKSTFDRQAGRVTELVARPLLSLLFPDALRFSQPLSGVIAGKKSVFRLIKFENDYGVDIGILLDILSLGVSMKEVDIGNISNKMKPWQQLSKMSSEVSRVILNRAQIRPAFSLHVLESTNVILDQMEHAVRESLQGMKKMALFDLDNTLFKGRFIEEAAKKFGFYDDFKDIAEDHSDGFLVTKLIARLLKGYSTGDLLEVAKGIPFSNDAVAVVVELKKRGYIVGLVTDGYEFIASYAANQLSADFVIANELEFSNGIATGEVKIPSYFARTKKSTCEHNFCKSNVMYRLSEDYGIGVNNILAIGDGENDICMVQFAGIGVAYNASSKILEVVADKVIEKDGLNSVLDLSV